MLFPWNRKSQIKKFRFTKELETLQSSIVIINGDNASGMSCKLTALPVLEKVNQKIISEVSSDFVAEWQSQYDRAHEKLLDLSNNDIWEFVRECENVILKRIDQLELILLVPKKYNYTINRRSAFRCLIHSMFKSLNDEDGGSFLLVSVFSPINNYNLTSIINERKRITSKNKYHLGLTKSAFDR